VAWLVGTARKVLDKLMGWLVPEGKEVPDDEAALEGGRQRQVGHALRRGGSPGQFLVEESRFRPEHLHGPDDGADECRAREPFEDGQKVVADGVPGDGGVGVGGVLAPWEALTSKPFAEVPGCLVEEGPDQGDGGLGGRGGRMGHAGESLRAGAAEKAEEKQLRLVAGVMGHRDMPDPMAGRDAGKEVVTEGPRGRLKALARPVGGVANRDGLGVARQPEPRRPVAHEAGVLAGVVASKLVVKMGHHEGMTVPGWQASKSVEQGHRVGPAGHGDDEGRAGGELAGAA
jgi:hypothetical protein